ncbi:alpha/beta hydrolase [Ferrimonas senticii]|uniref:alpha/beta hydrolase n=1 Tax=Ferrimonas senticii TaxID=394566 RepID=UPI0004075933|nr:alpha/beta hydrolase [Ferrimonas senticii]
MASWRSVALNKLLFRLMRGRLAKCNDVYGLRTVVAELEKLGSYISAPTAMEIISDQIAGVSCDWVSLGRGVGRRIILCFPGGGFCFRTPTIHAAALARLAQLTNSRGVLVNYRLAPEFPFPAAQQDGLAVYQQLLQDGYAAEDIVFLGDSAGANLAVTTMLLAREQGLPQPAAALLLSPAVDMTVNGESAFLLREHDPFFDLGTLLLMRNSYLNGHCPCDPLVSPIFAELQQLAPMMLHVGALEILRDDAVRLAAQVRRHGGEADLTIWPGMPHVFHLFDQLPEADEALRRMAQFIEQHSGQHDC